MDAKETALPAYNPRNVKSTTLSGVLQNSLGFWFTLCLFQGTAWLIWLEYEIIGYFYFYTKPLDLFGRGIPFH